MPKRAAHYWLVKSEPDAYSIDDLARDGTEPWSGVRNYTARNFMRDAMAIGDLVLFHHSNAKPPGVVGVAKVASASYPDPTQFDPGSPYYDPKATPEAPRWMLVDMQFVEKLPRMVTLAQAKADPMLDGMVLTGRARLSVQPVERHHFAHILALGGGTTKLRGA